MPTLTSKLKPASSKPKRSGPLWKGPEQDGITFSLLSRFLCCRERFRLLVVEGLRPMDQFNHYIEYGNMWHVCEEAHAAKKPWMPELSNYGRNCLKRYPLQQKQVEKWYNVCKVQFPIYVDYWSKHKDVVDRTPLMQEQVFDVPYKLPSGRTVRLRGKFDSVDLIGKGKHAGVYLQENKTKSEIDVRQLTRQLTFDLQTMIYLVALELAQGDEDWKGILTGSPIKGVRYNVIRRPLSGGKGSIVQHKPTKSNPEGESKDDYFQRLSGIIKDSPQDYFTRLKVEVTPGDIKNFRQQCLDPLLESLCAWWDWVTEFANPFSNQNMTNIYHWRHPFGVRNILDEGGSSDLDEYLETGSEVGLRRVDKLFTELA